MHCYSGKTEKPPKAKLWLKPPRNCAPCYCCKHTAFELLEEKSSSFTAQLLEHPGRPTGRSLPVVRHTRASRWITGSPCRVGGCWWHRVCSTSSAPGSSASLLLTLPMLFGLLFYFCFLTWPTCWGFLEGKLYFHTEMASALHGKARWKERGTLHLDFSMHP